MSATVFIRGQLRGFFPDASDSYPVLKILILIVFILFEPGSSYSGVIKRKFRFVLSLCPYSVYF